MLTNNYTPLRIDQIKQYLYGIYVDGNEISRHDLLLQLLDVMVENRRLKSLLATSSAHSSETPDTVD